MKRTFVVWIIGLALLVAVAVPLAMHAKPSPSAHPNIDSAIQSLEQAKMHLQEAEKYQMEEHKPDLFKGHRAKALTLVDQALQECHAALEAAK